MVSFIGFVTVATFLTGGGPYGVVTASIDTEPVQELRSLQDKAISFAPIDFPACSFESAYQNSESNRTYVPLSEYYSCISSFRLDQENATQYLESLINVTRDYYVFGDIAVDSLDSVPTTTMFDFPIYNGTREGRVDLMEEMGALVAEVKSEGAKLDLFLRVNDIYSKLLDAHVIINQDIYTAEMLDNNVVNLVPSDKARLHVAYPTDDGEFMLMADITDENNRTETKQIQTIDGMEPMDFFIETSSTSPFNSPYKSLGPRIQALIKGITNGIIYSSLNLSRVFRDSYKIVYADGTSSKWLMLKEIPSPVSRKDTKLEIEEALTEPGELYRSYDEATKRISTAFSQRQRHQRKIEARLVGEDRQLQELLSNSSSIGFTTYSFEAGSIGFAVSDGYAVLKVDSFESYDESKMLKAWNDLTNEAEAKGVTNLIIDIIGNGGGVVSLGYQLVQLMYPSANWRDLANKHDILDSPSLKVYREQVRPILDSIGQVIRGKSDDSFGNLQSILVDLNNDPDILVSKFNQIVKVLYAMDALVPNYINGPFGNTSSILESILENISSRTPPRILENEFQTILYEISNLDGNGIGLDSAGTFTTTEENSPVEQIRGGIARNYSDAFYQYDPTTFILWQSRVLQLENPFQFKQYIILGDGNGIGSTANTFQTTAVEYSKSHTGSVAPTYTLSYGGSGQKEDAAVTQFAGGSVKTADLSAMYLPTFLLLSMAILLEGVEIYDISVVNDILISYDSSVPEPCYFCNQMPRITFVEMYSVLVGTNSIPMEYVNQRPDFYIKQWPTYTHFLDDSDLSDLNSDLPELYRSAKEFFNENPPGDDGVLGSDYCMLSSNEACYKLGWPTCCLDKSLNPCPTEQPPCNVDPMTPIVDEIDEGSANSDGANRSLCFLWLSFFYFVSSIFGFW